MKKIELLCLVLVLMFIAVGCEDKLNKLPESTKPTEQTEPTKSLHQAAADGDVEQVKLLISKGADVNAEDEEEKTPLCYAVEAGKTEVVQLLVKAGSDVNAGSWPPLCVAVDKDNIALAEYLIAHGANVNAPEGWTALQEAPYASSVKMVELLIAKGANINAGPWTALHSAVNEGRRDIAEVLLANGADLNAKDKSGYTPLYYAIWNEDLDTAKLLIARGADVNVEDSKGRTSLYYAIREENLDTVKLLITHGADVNAKYEDGNTLLHHEVSRDVAELLISHGADFNAKDNKGRTPLHYAARFGNKNVVEFLIAKGADINAKDKQGQTPLYIAVHHDYKVAELLVDKGADGNIKTESGQTLFQLAQERKSIESTVPDMIFEGDPNSFLGPRIACGDIDGDGYDDILITRRENNKGRVYLFYGGPDMDTTADLIFKGETERDTVGGNICCGDIDNDGYDDILIVSYKYNNNQGRAYLYWGSKRNSMDANPDKIFDGEAQEGAMFGIGSDIYDIDNDGYRDIIFGAFVYPGDGTGRAYLYYGNKKELMDTSYDLIFTAENSGDQFGYAIGCGDVDNDGYGDIIIGARYYPGGEPSQGRAYLYYGDKRDKMDSKADEIFDAESKGTHFFGQGIVCIDQNKDGHDDIIIGAQRYKNRQGRAYLFYGDTRANLDTVADKVFDGEIEFSDYGFLILCGDIDGDSHNDIIIAADYLREQTGRAYIYWGSKLYGPSPKPGRIFTGENPGEWFSMGLACGDVNNDGYDDLVIGAKGYKAGSEQGRAYLYYGGPKN